MSESDSYGRAHAAFYDRRVGESDRADTEYYRDLAVEAGGPVLELACGTGRVYLELLRAGVDADGFDRSADALAVLRGNAARAGLEPSVWQADLRAFATDREYDLVVCPFNAVQHLLGVDAQQRLLRRTHDALAPGGRFVFDVFVPRFEVICERYGEWQTETVEYRGESHEVRTRSRVVEEVEQQFAVETELNDPDGDRVLAASHRLKLLPKREVELLARGSPFEEWDVTGDFEDRPVEDGDSTQVWTLARL